MGIARGSTRRRERAQREAAAALGVHPPAGASRGSSEPASDSAQLLDVHAALGESEARMQALLSSLDDLVFELDRDGVYLEVWTSRDELLVAPRAALLGRNVSEFLGEVLAEELVGRIRRTLESGAPDIMEYSLGVAAGTRWFQGRLAPIHRPGAPGTVCFLCRDITDRKAAERARDDAEGRLRHQALHDGLTGLPNRMYFGEHLDQELRRQRPGRDGLAVLILDIDRFKEINDTLGHAVGDLVLQEISRRLSAVTRGGDVIARLGGDEFALLLHGSGDDEAATVARRIGERLEDPISVDDVVLHIDVSAGMAMCPRDGSDAKSLLRRADIAMYAAKRASAGFAAYDTSMDHHGRDQLALVGELRGAIERGELALFYQPVVDLPTGEVTKVEALVRWLHPQRGIIPPGEFIGLVQEAAVMTSLTRFVLDQALTQCRQWIDEGRHLGVAVNVAMRDLIDAGFPHEVARLLGVHGVPPGLLTLEITEQSVMADPHRTKLVLDGLARMGVHLSVDDFGTGYSSLNYLTRLPVDEVKIDRSFVTRMMSEPDNEAIVRSTIELARNLGKKVVGEGVETEEVLDQLSALGCDRAQGFYLGRPVCAAALDRWLAVDDGSSTTGDCSPMTALVSEVAIA